jgi:hypothetical protein
MLKHIAAVFVLSVLYVTSAKATIITDPVFYDDLSTGISIDLAGFTIAGPASGPADLSLRFGQWSGPTAEIDLVFTFNGSALLPAAVSTAAYFGTPAYITYDVSSLVTTGLNTLSVFGTLISGGDTTYSVAEATLEYSAVESVPAPATLALFGLGLAGIGWSKRKKA